MSDNVVQTVPVGTMAKVLMLSERRVNQLEREGILQKETRGRYPLIPNIQSYIRYWQTKAVGADAGETDLGTEKIRLTKANADKAELEAAQMRGTLILADEALKEWSNAVSAMRAKLIALPGRLASKSVTLNSVREVEEYARSEIYLALDEIAAGDI